jgi:thiamine-phosphate pyrophosphorylase
MGFPRTPLYVICDEDVCARVGWSLTDYAAACLDGGARLLQVRMKRAPGRMFLETALAIAERARDVGATVIVNDRADIARLSGAEGVHIGQDDLSPRQVRAVVGTEAVVGLSTHTPEQLTVAVDEPIDYVAIGPVFGTMTKDTGYEAVGLSRVRQAVSIASARGLPVTAIGGITLDCAPAVLAAGATSLAVISDLLATGNPSKRVAEYLRDLRGPAGP